MVLKRCDAGQRELAGRTSPHKAIRFKIVQGPGFLRLAASPDEKGYQGGMSLHFPTLLCLHLTFVKRLMGSIGYEHVILLCCFLRISRHKCASGLEAGEFASGIFASFRGVFGVYLRGAVRAKTLVLQ